MTPLVKQQTKAARKPAASARAKSSPRSASQTGARTSASKKPSARKTSSHETSVQKTSSKKTSVQKTARRRKASAPRARAKHGDLQQLLERLQRAIPDPHVELRFEDPWQLLIAVILSAQSTDRMVNLVTPEVFRRWPTPAALAAAPQEEVELVVKSTGFFRNKAKAIRGASQMLVERFGGAVPRTLEQLIEVPGVARKTANVVLGAAYGHASGIVTDTHAMRVAQRLALTREQTPEKIEADLCRLFSQQHWIALSHQLVLHGRYLCTARAPACPRCPLNELCPSRQAPALDDWTERASAEASEMAERSLGFARPRANV